MRELLSTLLERLAAGQAMVYCRLVETRGSTPQKAGATMLVYPGGAQTGTLGGGCVEAEVKRRALALLSSGGPEVALFQLDSDYGWDDGLICGGRMQVLLDPLRSENDAHYFSELLRLLREGIGFQEAVVFDAQASGLSAAWSALFDAASQLIAQRHAAAGPGQSAAEERLRDGLLELKPRPRPLATRGVSYLPQLARCRLVIVGGGHVGQAVARLAAEVDFEVWVIDDRADVISTERFPQAQRRICGDFARVLGELEITPNSYCLIVTRGHNHDEQALYHLADRGAAYVGMIGSRRKIKLIFDDLEAAGVAPEVLARVHAPVGLEIGSQTVPEIAISILAELIAARNLPTGDAMRPGAAVVGAR